MFFVHALQMIVLITKCREWTKKGIVRPERKRSFNRSIISCKSKLNTHYILVHTHTSNMYIHTCIYIYIYNYIHIWYSTYVHQNFPASLHSHISLMIPQHIGAVASRRALGIFLEALDASKGRVDFRDFRQSCFTGNRRLRGLGQLTGWLTMWLNGYFQVDSADLSHQQDQGDMYISLYLYLIDMYIWM